MCSKMNTYVLLCSFVAIPFYSPVVVGTALQLYCLLQIKSAQHIGDAGLKDRGRKKEERTQQFTNTNYYYKYYCLLLVFILLPTLATMLGFWILWSVIMVGILITPGLGMWVLSRRRDQETVAQTIVAGTTDGSATCVFMEGDSPTICEVQSLVTAKLGPTYGATTVNGTTTNSFPTDYSRGAQREESTGFLARRLQMLLVVAKARLGIDLFARHVYVNVVGDARVTDTGADLAVALAMVSSHTSIAVRWDTCFIGEVGLWGELKPVQDLEARLAEARGFSRVVVPLDQKSTLVGSERSEEGSDGRPDVDQSESEAEDGASVVEGDSTDATSNQEGRADGITIVGCRDLKECIIQGFTAVPTRFRGLRKFCGLRAVGTALDCSDSPNGAQAADVSAPAVVTRGGTAPRGQRRIGISTLSPTRREAKSRDDERKEEIKDVEWGGEWGVVRRMG